MFSRYLPQNLDGCFLLMFHPTTAAGVSQNFRIKLYLFTEPYGSASVLSISDLRSPWLRWSGIAAVLNYICGSRVVEGPSNALG
jgi:hypothetical protein